jgi:hypothetical protein
VAERKNVPIILIDTGTFSFEDEENQNVARLQGTGASTHLGKIVSTGVFENVGGRASGGFRGKIEGTATTVAVPEAATDTSTEAATASSSQDTITYRLSAECFGYLLRHRNVSDYWRNWEVQAGQRIRRIHWIS